jgi:triosephosphate isomerase
MIKKFLVGGNWKLNGNLNLLKEFSSNKNFIEVVENSSEAIEVLICPAFPFWELQRRHLLVRQCQ